MSNYRSDHVTHTQQQMITNNSSLLLSSVQLPSVTKRPEPISFTLDQLQVIQTLSSLRLPKLIIISS